MAKTASTDPIQKFQQLWADKPNRDKAKTFAQEYCTEHHADLFPALGGKTREELVALVSAYRTTGQETERVKVDMWLLANFERQEITGIMRIGG